MIFICRIVRAEKDLNQFNGLAVCGGFSYGDVLGAGKGWSSTINFSDSIQEQFLKFFEDEQKFTLGVCNGCQMLSSIKEIIPEQILGQVSKKIIPINLKQD